MGKIRLLIVDDSSVMRTLLTKIFSSDPEIEVLDTAVDPYAARDKLVALKPDIMTLDIEMPKMDGLTFLEKVMNHFPTRTVIISSLSAANSATALRALELGAIDVIEKPSIDVTQSLLGMKQSLIDRVKAAARARMAEPSRTVTSSGPSIAPSLLGSAGLSKTTHQLIAIASSTGGTEALKKVLPYLPEDTPGIVVVQHMPPVFTKTYAEHLKLICRFEVKEAEDGDRVMPGRALIAPGNFHMELTRSGAYYYVKLHQEPPLHGVRPAADYLMKTVAKYAGENAIGVILTGMGKDGADGLLEMKKAGSYNIGQDEASCVVYGMPKVAYEVGALHAVCPLDQIAARIIEEIKIRGA